MDESLELKKFVGPLFYDAQILKNSDVSDPSVTSEHISDSHCVTADLGEHRLNT